MTFEQIRSVLSNYTVGIAGCGGLGSNCAVALARIGVGRLIVADFDVIVESNLNRQYFFFDQIGEKKCRMLRLNIGRINPKVVIQDHDLKLTRENIPTVFNECDIVVEAFDRAEEKQMLIETMSDFFPGIPLVLGLGMAGYGNNAAIHYRQLDNLHICGDEVTEIGPDMPPLAPRVGMVANMQANVVAELLVKKSSNFKF